MSCIRLIALYFLLVPLLAPMTSFAASPPSFEDEILALARIPSVVGRELGAAEFIRSRLGDVDVEQDALGNLTVTLGSGTPRRLFAAALDEHGYVVSHIQDDGYLRLTPLPYDSRGALHHQYLEGQKVTITTRQGQIYGAVTVPSAHLLAFRRDTTDQPPFTWQDAYVDIGVVSADEARDLGIRLLDPVVLEKRPTRLARGQISAPAIQSKAAAMALAEAARRLAGVQVEGTIVFAWTVLELLNGKGLEAVVHRHGPFDSALIASRNFGFESQDPQAAQLPLPMPLPEPGSGVLTDQPRGTGPHNTLWAPHLENLRFPLSGRPQWGDAQVSYLGLPTTYQDSPVELIHTSDVRQLADLWIRRGAGDAELPASPAPPAPPISASVLPGPAPSDADLPHGRLAETVASLIAQYGVSGAERPVRERIEALLPPWAEPVIDEIGNLTVSFGTGSEHAEHLVFVAHMDETGYRVGEIRDDGRLVLEARGGMLSWLWEAQAALVHTAGGPLPGIFAARADAHGAEIQRSPGPLIVDLGVASREAALALGVEAGVTSVTMPKRMVRIGTHRAVARGFDDRAGSAALLLAAWRLDPASLKRRITLAWSVQEETGLAGAKVLAERFQDVGMVYPIDTFVSSDAPRENRVNAYCPLGGGAVVRGLESINFAPQRYIDAVLTLAEDAAIPVQVGLTSGGTDGQPFLAYGIPSLPLSWPGRYSHSPIEVLDFRDLQALVDLITLIVTH